MSAGRSGPWSRAAVVCGVLALIAVPASVYYASSAVLALLALLLAAVGRWRGERSWHAWFWPSIAALAGVIAFAGYLYLTGGGAVDHKTADQVLKDNFADSFDENFKNVLGDGGGRGASSWPGGPSSDGGW